VTRIATTLVLALVASACGGDDSPPPPPPPAPGAAAAGQQKAIKDKKGQLQARTHVEDRVTCPVPEKPTGPACNIESPTCDAGLFCIATGNGNFCEPCPERDSIRHEFKDRDFVADQTRDPFQSFIIVQKGLEEPAEKHEDTGPCKPRTSSSRRTTATST